MIKECNDESSLFASAIGRRSWCCVGPRILCPLASAFSISDRNLFSSQPN